MDNQDHEEAAGQDNQKLEQDIEADLDWIIRRVNERIYLDPLHFMITAAHSTSHNFQDPNEVTEFVKRGLELLQNPVFMDEAYKRIRAEFREDAVKMVEMMKDKKDMMENIEKLLENFSLGIKDQTEE